MAGDNKINWRIWEVPVGPEDDIKNRRKSIFHAPKEETLVQYERLRQEGGDGTTKGLVVTNQHGDVVYACS